MMLSRKFSPEAQTLNTDNGDMRILILL